MCIWVSQGPPQPFAPPHPTAPFFPSGHSLLAPQVVKRAIPNEEACDALIDLIKENGMWKDKEEVEEDAAVAA